MNNIVFLDSKSHQAIRHAGTEKTFDANARRAGNWAGQRLAGFEADLVNRGFEMVLGEISSATIHGASVVIISGRNNRFPFSDDELSDLEKYYQDGGGLFLMANHAGFVAPQNQVANALGIPVTFNEENVTSLQPCVSADSLHQTLVRCGKGLQLRTSCTMSLGPEGIIPVLRDTDPKIGVIAAALENSDSDRGRVYVTTSAGHIASLDDSNTNLYAAADNANWTLDIVSWLCS